METIRNKVAESGLIQLDLADFKPKQEIASIDIATVLWEGFVLKEKDFRAWVKEHDWQQYKHKAVSIYCSADAIIPTWAYMLIGSALNGIAFDFIIGTTQDLLKKLIMQEINAFDIEPLKEGRIIIKGCSDIESPEFAMTELIKRIQPVAQSILYGEPCSTVPIYKRKAK